MGGITTSRRVQGEASRSFRKKINTKGGKRFSRTLAHLVLSCLLRNPGDADDRQKPLVFKQGGNVSLLLKQSQTFKSVFISSKFPPNGDIEMMLEKV